MIKPIVNVGDHVLIDPCPYGNAHPSAWLIGIVERELETGRFLIRYLAPDRHGLSWRIHTRKRAIRAVGSAEHVERVFKGVRECLKPFEKEKAQIEKAKRAHKKRSGAIYGISDDIEFRDRDLWRRERDVIKTLHQPGLIRWSLHGGVKIDSERKKRNGG